MKKILSFTVDHTRLEPGVYVSRKDTFEKTTLTTFDLRITTPNREPVMGTAEIHTIEHLGATYLRNHAQWGSRTVYFGPMGCRTGFYVIFEGNHTSQEILPVIIETFRYISEFSGSVPGASPHDCGNYLDMNLNMAKYFASRYLQNVLTAESTPTNYPDGKSEN